MSAFPIIHMTALQVFAVVAVLAVLDALLTIQVLKRGGRELNPVINDVIKAVGRAKAFVVTRIVGLAIFAYLLFWPPVTADSITAGMAFMAMYAGVVLWNVYVLLRMRR